MFAAQERSDGPIASQNGGYCQLEPDKLNKIVSKVCEECGGGALAIMLYWFHLAKALANVIHTVEVTVTSFVKCRYTYTFYMILF